MKTKLNLLGLAKNNKTNNQPDTLVSSPTSIDSSEPLPSVKVWPAPSDPYPDWNPDAPHGQTLKECKIIFKYSRFFPSWNLDGEDVRNLFLDKQRCYRGRVEEEGVIYDGVSYLAGAAYKNPRRNYEVPVPEILILHQMQQRTTTMEKIVLPTEHLLNEAPGIRFVPWNIS